MKQNNKKLFEYIFELCMSDGGDGDITVIFTDQNLHAVADQFFLFLKEQTYGSWNRNQSTNGYETFSNDQETIRFSDRDDFCSYLEALSGKGYPEGKIPCSWKVIVP